MVGLMVDLRICWIVVATKIISLEGQESRGISTPVLRVTVNTVPNHDFQACHVNRTTIPGIHKDVSYRGATRNQVALTRF